jgi:hypothetical protein
VIELIFELLVEFLWAGAGEWLIEGLARLVGASFGRTDRQHPVLAGIGLLLMGAAVGGISAYVWPYQIAGNGPFPGLSIIVSPLVNGLALEAIGRWRDRHGKPRTYLSTFWGAATFAFAVAAVRFWLVGGR